jgi:hypothetical protein
VGGRLVERSNEIYRLFIPSARFVVGIGRVTAMDIARLTESQS